MLMMIKCARDSERELLLLRAGSACVCVRACTGQAKSTCGRSYRVGIDLWCDYRTRREK